MKSLKVLLAFLAVLVVASAAFGSATDKLFDLLYGNNFTLKQVQKLIKAGAKVNGRDDTGQTPLICASSYKEKSEQLDVVKFLLKAGADVNARDEEGCTALMSASTFNLTEVIKTLLAAGADVESRSETGYTALRFNVRSFPDPVTINMLIKAGADVNSIDNYGITILMEAARNMSNDESQINSEVFKALITAGANINVKNKDGKTVWDYRP